MRGMLWLVTLEDESGAELESVRSVEDGALRSAQQGGDRYPRLSEIDPYGTTVLSKLQIASTTPELRHLLDDTQDEEEAHWLVEVLRLMEKASSRVHTFVRFRGDRTRERAYAAAWG